MSEASPVSMLRSEMRADPSGVHRPFGMRDASHLPSKKHPGHMKGATDKTIVNVRRNAPMMYIPTAETSSSRLSSNELVFASEPGTHPIHRSGNN